MIATAHLLLGALIGKTFSNLLIISILAFISHFLLDAIPHWDEGSFKKRWHYTAKDWLRVATDVIIGSALVIYFAITNDFWPIIFGAGFAILPDVVHNLAHLLKWQRVVVVKQLNELHDKFAFNLTRELLWLGIILEVAVILAVLSLLLF